MNAAVSIVIPVRDRAALTAACLDAVLADLPADAEVVVVDDASSDATGDLLQGYGGVITALRMDANVGFARACNEGAQRAAGALIVFLNNDTEPRPGWLAELRRVAEENPTAAIVGARLLYPNGSIQHAGVAFGQDGYPHHIYAGFPADHPAVSHPRRLQAVTGACMLVRRSEFELAGGFDEGFLNSLEDVDLCLRIGELGGEVHYCPGAVAMHLESASRGRGDRFERSVALYRERWRDRVRRDDVELYLADGLLAVEYAESYPIRFSIDARLAIVDAGREEQAEELLEGYARQVSGLLQEVVRLSTAIPSEQRLSVPSAESGRSGAGIDRRAFLARAGRVEDEIRQLQIEAGGVGVAPSTQLGYRRLVEQVRGAVEEHVPKHARVLVVSRGDRALTRFDHRTGGHFPQTEAGDYLGHHPADSGEAIAHLEQLRSKGADFLVVPSTALWWLEHYGDLADHLHERYQRIDSDSCILFRLTVDAVRSSIPSPR